MSNQEYCQKLFKDYFELSKEFMTMDRELSGAKDVTNINDVPKYAAVKQQWQAAISKYWDFLSLLKGKNINPNDEVQLS